ncbi:hypothetical protein [Spongiactinospora gelatinilytica]|uniref:hypothetical protein n=1 Tax=Spongiactinospora gelatinilytica TaxID=2666298 RepID=UPI0011B947F9|nr:hypothetical protein [Spongiactinospora gelatinilytica]
MPTLLLIQPEESPRLTTARGWEDECLEWTMLRRPYGDTRPQDREKAFMCHARSGPGGVLPLFPDDMADRRDLGDGRAMCAAGTPEERRARHGPRDGRARVPLP